MGEGKPSRARRRHFDAIVLTCEHGGNRVPPAFARLFRGADKVLKSHRGLDIGALAVAKHLAHQLKAPLYQVTVSRLLIDLNRSLHHPRAFSEYTRHLSKEVRLRIAELYFHPHRRSVETWIQRQTSRQQRVLHLGIHSFTPELHGVERNAEIGILYDAKRSHEQQIALNMQSRLRSLIEAQDLPWRIRRNYPYNGAADGFTTALRLKNSERKYMGIEIELNQAIVKTTAGQRRMAAVLGEALLAL